MRRLIMAPLLWLAARWDAADTAIASALNPWEGDDDG